MSTKLRMTWNAAAIARMRRLVSLIVNDKRGKEARSLWYEVLNKLRKEFPIVCASLDVNSLKRKYKSVTKADQIQTDKNKELLNQILTVNNKTNAKLERPSQVANEVDCEEADDVEINDTIPPLEPSVDIKVDDEDTDDEGKKEDTEVTSSSSSLISNNIDSSNDRYISVVPSNSNDMLQSNLAKKRKRFEDGTIFFSSSDIAEIRKLEELRLQRAKTVLSTEILRFLRSRDDLMTHLFTPDELRDEKLIADLSTKTRAIVDMAVNNSFPDLNKEHSSTEERG